MPRWRSKTLRISLCLLLSSVFVSMNVGVVSAADKPTPPRQSPSSAGTIPLKTIVPGDTNNYANNPPPTEVPVPSVDTECVKKTKLDSNGKPVLDPVTGKPIQECEYLPKVGERATTTYSGVSGWAPSEVLRDSSGDGLGYDVRRAVYPNNLPKGEAEYRAAGTPCMTYARYMSNEGFYGWYSPSGVPWTVIVSWIVDGNHEIKILDSQVVYGECIWPQIEQVVRTCPYSVSNVYAYGPYGEGLPVMISPTETDPKSKPIVEPLPPTTVYSPLAEAMEDGSFFTLSKQEKASMVANCETDLSKTFRYKPKHTGNYQLAGDGLNITCSYFTFLGVSKFATCNEVTTMDYYNEGYLDCDGNVVYPGWLDDYDFSCRVPVENRVCTTQDPNCPTSTVVPEAITDPTNPPLMIPSPLPGRNTIVCLWDYPKVQHPQNGGNTTFLNKAVTVPANGRPWELNWGDMRVLNAPAVDAKWTRYYVDLGSTPGDEELDADSVRQPFNGTYNGQRVLQWEEGEDTDDLATGGVDGPEWARTLTMNWYQAGMSGVNEYSMFTVSQRRNFTWQRTINANTWGSTFSSPLVQTIPQTCESPSASFIVVGGRNTSGNTLGR